MKNAAVLLSLLLSTFFVTAQINKCTSGDCANGVGTYVFDNGNTYTGSFKNYLKDGKGVFTWVAGDVYNGDWVQDIKKGTATNIFAGGAIYIGEFDNNTMTGKGVYTLANRYSMRGIFKNNVGIDVKYFDNTNKEITEEIYSDSEKEGKEQIKLQNKGKLQIQSITIPAPNGVYSMTDRADDVKMQFSNSNSNFLYLWGERPTVITINDAKVAARSSYETLSKTDLGREILSDFNKSSSTTNDIFSPHFKQKGNGFANHKFQIKINKGKPFGINNDSTFVVTLYNYQKFIDEETISNFNFWKNDDERKAYHKNEKDIYYAFLKSNGRDNKYIKEVYEKNNKTKITDIHASYDSIKSMAHVVFTFSHLKYSQSHNVMYDIDFKNKTYKKIAESDFQANVNDDCYSYLTSIQQDEKAKQWFRNFKIINFDNNSTIDIDKPYVAKLNNLTNPVGDVEFVTANKGYLLFKSVTLQKIVGSEALTSNCVSYYFVNKISNFCEKIINVNHQPIGNKIVFNSDFSKAAFSQNYRLNPKSDYVNSIYIIDFENLSVQLVDDHQYQLDAIKNSTCAPIAKETVPSVSSDEQTYTKSQSTTDCVCSKCNGTGKFTVKTIEVYYPEVVNSNGKVVGYSSYSKTIDKYEDMTCGKCLGTGKCN